MFYKKIYYYFSNCIFIISYCIVYIYGRENYIDINISDMKNISIKYDEEFLTCNKTINDSYIHLDISANKTGKTEVIVKGDIDYDE